MSVIPLTIFFSLLLAGLFIGLFVHEQHRRRFASTERDSLLPLAEETPHEVKRCRAGSPDTALSRPIPPSNGGISDPALQAAADPYPESLYF